MTPTPLDRKIGCFRGLAIGDALGAPVEFQQGPITPAVLNFRPTPRWSLNPGEPTDDTSMALALAEALIASQGYDSYAVMEEYKAWWQKGKYSPTNTCFDIGNQTIMTLREYGDGNTISPEKSRTRSAGNGSLMRLAPAAIVAHNGTVLEGDRLCSFSARETHYSVEAEAFTVVFGRLLRACFEDYAKDELFRVLDSLADGTGVVSELARWQDLTLVPDGYARHSLQVAWACFQSTDNFEDAVLQAVNMGGDADTNGAITAQLAGAFYGDSSIPDEWCRELWRTSEFPRLVEQLVAIPPHILRTRFQEDGDLFAPKSARGERA